MIAHSSFTPPWRYILPVANYFLSEGRLPLRDVLTCLALLAATQFVSSGISGIPHSNTYSSSEARHLGNGASRSI